MTTAKNKVFIGLLLENCYLVEGMNFWWRGGGDKRRKERIFPGGMSKFQVGGGTPPKGKPCYPLQKSKEEKLFLQS